jgi:translation elongation factor EF-4
MYRKAGIDYESDLSNYGTCWINFDMPLAEIVFYDRLKTVSKGYASFDYVPRCELQT